MAQRKKLEAAIRTKKSIHAKAEAKWKKAENALNGTLTKLYELRAKCKHRFPNEKNPSMMGRGKCDICGQDDY